MPAKVRVKIGQPIDLSAYYGREREEGVTGEITKRLLLEIARLAGHPEFEPQVAGRRWKPGTEIDAVESLNGQNGSAVKTARRATLPQ
jgi:hypothetical protein